MMSVKKWCDVEAWESAEKMSRGNKISTGVNNAHASRVPVKMLINAVEV